MTLRYEFYCWKKWVFYNHKRSTPKHGKIIIYAFFLESEPKNTGIKTDKKERRKKVIQQLVGMFYSQ